jgi:hypothetical protein
MAYPEPVPVLKAKHARDFEKRLNRKKLSRSQKDFYKGSVAEAKKHHF